MRRLVLLVAGSTALAAASVDMLSLTMVDSLGFWPPIRDDASLNANVRTLDRQVAWKNQPGADPFRLALEQVTDRSMDKVRLVELRPSGVETAEMPR
jgi:hypothetical protein